MIEVFHIGQNDRLEYYRIQVRDSNGPISLSDVTDAYFNLKNISTGSVIISEAAVITDALNGNVEYRWAVADTAVVGEYAASFLFVTPSGNRSLPRSNMAKIIIEDKYNIGS